MMMIIIAAAALAGIIAGVVYLVKELKGKDAVIASLNEQCSGLDAEIQTLNQKCNDITEECWKKDKIIRGLRKENKLLNDEILKYNPQWRFRSTVADLMKKATHEVTID
ncbi:MAG: hypothetical protein IJQ75_01095 [Synergistaceae bacterium]|nr:hypothetical protein [Synergistaceae bacterium]